MQKRSQLKTHSSPKNSQPNNILKYIKILRSFDTNRSSQKQQYQNKKNQHSFRLINKDNLTTIPYKKVSAPLKTQSSQRYKKHVNTLQNPETIQKYSKSANIHYLCSHKNISLPSIKLIKITLPSKRYSISNIPTTHNRIHTQPIDLSSKNLPRMFFNRMEGSPNGNLLEFSKLKPTQKYFSKLQNVRLAQRLLLMQPSKDLRKSQHKKFYQQQKTYRQQISQSTLLKKNQQTAYSKLKIKKHRFTKSEWIN